MNVDFTRGHLTIVVSPVDLRAGYRRLSLIARTLLGIAVEDGGHFVAFVSRDRALCKVIWSDEAGSSVLTRRLHRGRFERFLVEASRPEIKRTMTPKDFIDFLDGRKIFRSPVPIYL